MYHNPDSSRGWENHHCPGFDLPIKPDLASRATFFPLPITADLLLISFYDEHLDQFFDCGGPRQAATDRPSSLLWLRLGTGLLIPLSFAFDPGKRTPNLQNRIEHQRTCCLYC